MISIAGLWTERLTVNDYQGLLHQSHGLINMFDYVQTQSLNFCFFDLKFFIQHFDSPF